LVESTICEAPPPMAVLAFEVETVISAI